MNTNLLPLAAVISLATASVTLAIEIDPLQVEFFEQRIRPVLVEHCYECHNTAETTEGGLSLDHRQALRRGGETGSVIAASPDDSLLLKVIRHEIDGLEMPEGAPKLGGQVIADFQKWVEMGAPDPRDEPPSADELAESTSWEVIREKRKRWWSFQPIVRPKVPGAVTAESSSHPVDRLIRSKINAAGLSAAPRADQSVLVRRLSFALTGLPPTPEAIADFVNDSSRDAYERYVDRLLGSTHFGERWARHWMDWMRYAESHGSEGDPLIDGAHYYRDYLIRSINADVPYDQMVREHIAGDLLEKPRINDALQINESQIATAHWRMVFHGFAPTDAMDEKVRFTDDAINVFSKAFLGLTVSCARCHHHKFDPISQDDYYALFGIIGSTRPGRAAIDVPERLNRHRESLEQLKPEIRLALAHDWLSSIKTLPSRLTAANAKKAPEGSLVAFFHNVKEADDFARELTRRQARTHVDNVRPPALRHWNFSQPDDQQDWFSYGSGTTDRVSPPGAFSLNPSSDSLNPSSESVVRGIYPSGVYSHMVSDKHHAVFTSPTFHLTGEHDLWLKLNGDGSAISRYVVQDYPRKGTVYPVTELKKSGWRWQKYDMTYWKGDDVHIELATAKDSAVLVKKQDRSWFGIREAIVLPKGVEPQGRNEIEWMQPILDQARANPPESFEQLVDLACGVIVGAIEAWREDRLTDAQALLLDRCVVERLLPNEVGSLPTAAPLVARYRSLEEQIPVARRAPALTEWAGSDQPLYERGDHKRPGKVIPRRFLEAIDATPYQSTLSGRRRLAEDVLRQDNPLTSRVIVNRIWHHLFGTGIVGTTNNFGRLGQTPTHPELLDFLADEFRTEDAWSLKSMIRRIVTSETWKQQSVPSAKANQIDPENRLYTHYPIRRLEAEAIRDAMLAVSDRLDDTMFGDSVSGDSNRRSVYVKVIRNALDPFLATFDAPVPFSSNGKRDATNVPAQALMLMNNPQVVRHAKQFASRVLGDASLLDDSARIGRMWVQALGRNPTDDELRHAKAYLSAVQLRNRQAIARAEQMAEEISQLERLERELIAGGKVGTGRTAVTPRDTKVPNPIARWGFDEPSAKDADKDKLVLHGGARLDNGALVLDGQGWAASGPMAFDLSEKTLEVVVKLGDLNQSGGGVMTVQNLRGNVFDSIVFAEKKPRRWLAGSDHHRRTTSFQGTMEHEADTRPVHLAITYDKQGNVTLFRNGVRYGESYRTSQQSFESGEFRIVFGIRHGNTAGGNRMLSGRVLEASLYDRALSRQDVALLASGQADLFAKTIDESSLSESERIEWTRVRTRSAALRSQLKDVQSTSDPNQHWIDLAHSIFNMKEFIYVR